MNTNKIVIYIAVGISISFLARYAIPRVYKEFKDPVAVKCSKVLRANGMSDKQKYCLNDDLTAPVSCYFRDFEKVGCKTLRFLEALNMQRGFLVNIDMKGRPIKCKKILTSNGKVSEVCLDHNYRIPIACYFGEKDTQDCKAKRSIFEDNTKSGFTHNKKEAS